MAVYHTKFGSIKSNCVDNYCHIMVSTHKAHMQIAEFMCSNVNC